MQFSQFFYYPDRLTGPNWFEKICHPGNQLREEPLMIWGGGLLAWERLLAWGKTTQLNNLEEKKINSTT